MKRRALALILILGLMLALTSLSAAGCQAVPSPATSATGETVAGESTAAGESTVDVRSQATLDRYRVNEVREYKGQRLDPAIGPRDNSIKGVQTVDIDSYRLSIEGLVQKPIQLTYAEVLKLPPSERLITLYCVEGWQATILWKGVLIEDLINQAGGAAATAKTVIFHSVDDYTTSLPLATVLEKHLIMAYSANDLDLPPEMGYPLIVVAEEKLGYKWARWVNAIELSDDANYLGYWEQRGYSNEADLE
jgi:DMSO/TMAO reductase YedYZ molybdopterin-dependent catalytic subunit